MVWIKRLMIIFVLALMFVICTGLVDQTGSGADEWILAKAESASEKNNGAEIYFSEKEETTKNRENPFFRSFENRDELPEESMQLQVSEKALPEDLLQKDALQKETSAVRDELQTDTADQKPSDTRMLLEDEGAVSKEDMLPHVSTDDWELILINKQHPIPEDYEVELGSIHNGQKVDKRITKALDDMLSAAADDGVRLLVISPYRTTARQKELFDKKVRRAMKQGMSYLEAYKDTAQTVTIPGFSEHECGLAADITTKEHITLDAAYSETEGGMWLSAHCSEYGFILRYPVGKEEITGIEFEPWHFRYVGKEAAAYIMEHDLTLEEFVHILKTAESDMEED